MPGFRKESFYIEKYGEELGKKKYEELVRRRDGRLVRRPADGTDTVVCQLCKKEFKKISNKHLQNKCVEKITLDEYKSKFPNVDIVSPSLKKLYSNTKESIINKYGLEVGSIRWQSYCDKQAETNSFEYKADKFGMTEEEFKEYNKSRSSTLSNFVERHGEEKGIEMWDAYCERQRYTTTLEYFVEKYGDEGEEKWLLFCEQRAKSSDIGFIMSKYQVTKEEAEQILSERKTCKDAYISQGEKNFVLSLKQIISDIDYTYETKQFCIWCDETWTPMFYDVTSSKRKKIIEYNGDYWHCNPLIYEDMFFVKQCGMTAKEIRERDSKKIASAQNRGFEVLVVWESDFLQNTEQVLKRIEGWWNG